jgi:trimethylamine:corrinoid methyltransferase-like protein
MVSQTPDIIPFTSPFRTELLTREQLEVLKIDAIFNNTVKHVQTVTVMGERMAHYAVRMAEVLASSRDSVRASPPLCSLVCTIAPLAQAEQRAILDAAEREMGT